MLDIFKYFRRNSNHFEEKSQPNIEKDNFSPAIYARHSWDVARAFRLGTIELKTKYEHYQYFGRNEGRARTYRRLNPGESINFKVYLSERALSGLQMLLGVENACPEDCFSLTLFNNGKVFFNEKLPFGCVALDRATDILTGPISGLSEMIQVRLAVSELARNSLWLMTTSSSLDRDTDFTATAFYDDPKAEGPEKIGLILSPVSQCNQNCPHCISQFSRQSFKKMSVKVQDEVRNLAASGRIRMLSVDYSGDAFFANSRYFPIFDFIDELGCLFRVDTNGAYVDENTMRRVARGRLHEINFSLDAATSKTHSRLRPGKIAFEVILQNIRRTVEILKEEGRDDVVTSANFSIMHSNIDEVLPFADLVHELGLKNAVYSHVHAYQAETRFESLLNEPHRFNQIHDTLVTKLLAKGLGFSVPPPFVDGLESSGRVRCCAPWNGAVILANGDVQACCIPGTKIGNLSENTFEQVWTSEEAQKFRNEAASPNGKICSQCVYGGPRGVPAPQMSTEVLV